MQDIANNQVYTSPKSLTKLLHTNFIFKKKITKQKKTAKFFSGSFKYVIERILFFILLFKELLLHPLKTYFIVLKSFEKSVILGFEEIYQLSRNLL